MVATLNRTNFAGVQRVTCWTCHHGASLPRPPSRSMRGTTLPTSSSTTPFGRRTDCRLPTRFLTNTSGGWGRPASGRAHQLCCDRQCLAMASWAATPISPCWRRRRISGDAHHYKDTQRPPASGRSTGARVDQDAARTPGDYELIGSELDGARLTRSCRFQADQAALTNWRGARREALAIAIMPSCREAAQRFSRRCTSTPHGLLSRLVRYGLRRLAHADPDRLRRLSRRGGIKFPFEYKFMWLDGRYTAKLAKVETNVAIDATKFGRPSAK